MIRKQLPNMMTLGNLFCGCLAIVFSFRGHLEWASLAIAIALILDFFDGFTARLLKVSSPIGKDLDSLADMVTFGVLPGLLMFQMIEKSLPTSAEPLNSYLPYVGFLVTVFSCVRLAKFNNDTRQSDSFIGVPTPANTIFIASIALLNALDPQSVIWLQGTWTLVVMALVCAYLLIAEVPLIALKFKSFKWQGNAFRYLLLGGSLLLLVVFQLKGLPLAIVLYILLSIVNNIFSKKAV